MLAIVVRVSIHVSTSTCIAKLTCISEKFLITQNASVGMDHVQCMCLLYSCLFTVQVRDKLNVFYVIYAEITLVHNNYTWTVTVSYAYQTQHACTCTRVRTRKRTYMHTYMHNNIVYSTYSAR